MKIITFFFIIITLFGCKDKESNKISEFTEKDAYTLINTHFIKQLKEYNSDSIIYWNDRILRTPEYEYTYIRTDSIPNIPIRKIPFPVFSKEYWNTNQIKNIKVVNYNEYSFFLKKNDSIDLENLWNSKFKNEYIHNVSYPLYNPETKIAVIEDYRYGPYIYCGTGLNNFYFYRKTLNGWEKLK